MNRPSQKSLHYLALILLPIVILLINDDWCFNPLQTLDPWLYLGFALNYPDYVGDWFPGTYYGSRLSAILPKFIIYKTLPPLMANYVSHLLFYYISIFSLYGLLVELNNRTSAFIAALLLGSHYWFWRAIGWEYT